MEPSTLNDSSAVLSVAGGRASLSVTMNMSAHRSPSIGACFSIESTAMELALIKLN